MYYIGSGLACIMLHRYNDERGEQNEKFNYAFYRSRSSFGYSDRKSGILQATHRGHTAPNGS